MLHIFRTPFPKKTSGWLLLLLGSSSSCSVSCSSSESSSSFPKLQTITNFLSYQSRSFSYTNKTITIHELKFKAFFKSTTELQPFQVFCKQVKCTIRIFDTCCLPVFENPSSSQTVEYCARRCSIPVFDQKAYCPEASNTYNFFTWIE